ncbi:MAG: BolA family protein [Polyangiaceae bacterium]
MSFQARIAEKLTAALAPIHLDVVNESHMHSVAPGSETHFKVLVVSPAFDGKSLIERHRTVNALLGDEFKSGLHALTIRALTPAQWESDGASGFKSPPCLGGSKTAAKADPQA